ncbi:SH3 domain-containing protein [Propioniciclava sinopodophylli]|uniref:SH3 domain-containing protein n=1 Tax=Propioniciclava sinopodophylli TaxID=1837344 RepID=UPI002491A00E|nr:SH3 domain-containing protein [Propioniciclava sinopodophylli]
MYEARRAADPQAAPSDAAAAFVVPARRASRSRGDFLRTRVAPTAVSVALLATSGAFALNLRATEEATATPAPVRAADPVSRDTARTLVETTEEAPAEEAPAEEAPAEAVEVVATEGAEAFIGGQWAAAIGAPAGTKFTQTDVVVRAQASGDAAKLGTVSEGDKVAILDKTANGFRQIKFGSTVGYVLDSKLGNKAPVKKEAPKTEAATPKESTKESTTAAPAKESASKKEAAAPQETNLPAPGKSVLGLKPRAMVVYNAVTARWSFKAIGGYRASSLSNHQYGGAIDFMTYSDSAKGWAVAKYLAENAAAFNVDHIIFEQKIWTPYKPYWRPMADRGSITANHYDHVHVSVKL